MGQYLDIERANLLDTLPHKPTVDEMIDATDIVLAVGLKEMAELVMGGAGDIDQRIKAVNTVISIGKFMDSRKQDGNKKGKQIIFDVDSMIARTG